MKIGMQVTGLDRVRKELERLSGPEMRGAYAKALTDTAYQVRREMQQRIQSAFDRPTPFITRSPKVFPATPDKLEAYVAPTYRSDVPTAGGKIGVDPQQVLQAQEFGGRRRDKRGEVALRRAGILPSGYQLALPKTPYPGSDDGRGNIRGPFMAQLISYLQASSEQGYRANMTARRMAQIQKGSAKAAGRRYFVAYGRLRGGKGGHLAPGIWAASGTGGVDVRPVLMFVRLGYYKPRIDMQSIAASANVNEYLGRRLRFRIREAAGV